ncbi:MAG: 50S ribosomal protein L6 [Nanoarchaeota archaeon]
MSSKNYVEEIELPEGVSANREDKLIQVKGPKGEVTKSLYNPLIIMEVTDNKVVLRAQRYGRREKTLIGTFRAHVKNMVKGVTEGHSYTLKICSGHFPMNVSFSNNVLTIKNFIGEKVPRTLTVSDKVNLKVDGENIVIESLDKDVAGQTAGSIEKLTKRVNFDKRIFQDGIYIVEKDGKKLA